MIFGINKDSRMNWYYYLNYSVFKFYERKSDSMPALFSFLVAVSLISLNVFSVVGIIQFFLPGLSLINKINMVALYGAISLFTYLALYRGNHYKKVFQTFDQNRETYKNWDKSVLFCIIITVVLLLSVLVIADLRNHGRL